MRDLRKGRPLHDTKLVKLFSFIVLVSCVSITERFDASTRRWYRKDLKPASQRLTNLRPSFHRSIVAN